MKAQRLNLCTSVRGTIHALGYSSVAICNATNAELGKVNTDEVSSKLGDGKIAGKGTEYKATRTTTEKLHGKLTMPLYFDAWHSAIARIEKIAPFGKGQLPIPAPFILWFDKFAKADKKEIAEEAELTVEEEAPEIVIADKQEPVAAK